MKKVALIGAGKIARVHAANLKKLAKNFKLELTIVCAASKKSTQSFQKRYGFKKEESLADLCSGHLP